ncbi:hypothetical protein [Immundisolibacter sp.]|uniref:hypothetical protein n=1 Tax=Immundisolibacter sp. TaxID=1934948 RepID=UPI0035645030
MSVSAMRLPMQAPLQCVLNLATETGMTQNGTGLCRITDFIELPVIDVGRKQGAIGRASGRRVVAELFIERMQ